MEKGSKESELLIRATLDFLKKIELHYDVMQVDDKIVLKTKDNKKAVVLDKLFETVLDKFFSSNVVNSDEILDKK